MGRDTIQYETAVSTISPEYLLEFTSEYGIVEELHPELPSPWDRIVDFPEDERVFPTMVDWRVSAPKDEMPVAGSYSPEDVVVLNTRRTPIQKQPEALLCLVGLSRRYFLGDDVYPTFLNDDDRGGDERNLFKLANFPLRLWTSLIVRGDGSCSTTSVLSGHGFIPSGLLTTRSSTYTSMFWPTWLSKALSTSC
ncbi:hypothetical protein Tco_1021702, partial [Tanacetum coccineum]